MNFLFSQPFNSDVNILCEYVIYLNYVYLHFTLVYVVLVYAIISVIFLGVI